MQNIDAHNDQQRETCVLHVPAGAMGYDAWVTALGSNWSIAYDL